jgi:hypothetical protein
VVSKPSLTSYHVAVMWCRVIVAVAVPWVVSSWWSNLWQL